MDMELFKQMFSEFCSNEVKDGNCDGAYCGACCVGQAWERIFWEDEQDYEEDGEDM